MAVNDDAKELGGILGEIKRAIEDLDGGFKKGSNSLQSIVDIASQYNDYQSNSIKLNSEQLSQLSKKLKNEKSSLESSQQSLQNSISQNAQEKLKLQLQINSLKTHTKTKIVCAPAHDHRFLHEQKRKERKPMRSSTRTPCLASSAMNSCQKKNFPKKSVP